MEVGGIEYQKPTVIVLQETGIGVPEYAARTCYDSFENSENECVKDLNYFYNDGFKYEDPETLDFSTNNLLEEMLKTDLNNIEHSDLLDDLAWTYFHHSILEHSNISYLIKGTSRGVLQEIARHRIGAYSVRSTRYTMSNIINAFVASLQTSNGKDWFINKCTSFDMLATTDKDYQKIEWENTYDKLLYQVTKLGIQEFFEKVLSKESLNWLKSEPKVDINDIYNMLQRLKKKRNVGDGVKHIVTDNWKVDLVVTYNLRSLKNFFQLRDSGAAYFQIKWLAQEMKKVTPKKYLNLIIKSKKED